MIAITSHSRYASADETDILRTIEHWKAEGLRPQQAARALGSRVPMMFPAWFMVAPLMRRWWRERT